MICNAPDPCQSTGSGRKYLHVSSLCLLSQKKGAHCPDAILGEGHKVITKKLGNAFTYQAFPLEKITTQFRAYMLLQLHLN